MAGSQTKRDIALILAASFFYMASPMLITPIITGFSESLGASGVMMGFIGGIISARSSAAPSSACWLTESANTNSPPSAFSACCLAALAIFLRKAQHLLSPQG